MRYTLGFVCVLALGVVGCGETAGGDEIAAAPTLTVVSPAEGSALGGTELTLGGTNFVSGATVSVGGAPATQIIVVSPTAIECLSPPGTPGVVDVAVTTSSGTATLEDAFNYYPTPAVISVEPARGPPLGGTPLTLTGTGFIANDAGTNTVTVGGAGCADVDAVSDTEVTCTSPAGTAGAVDVVLTNGNGIATLEDGYEYFSPILVADGGDFEGDKNLYELDAKTGEAFPIGPIGLPVTAMDFHPQTGVLYGVTGYGYDATTQLITIDTTTGEGTVVGGLIDEFGYYQAIPGISFVGDVLYGTNSWNGGLVTIDVTSGRVEVLFENAPLAPGGGFAADATGDNVYYMTFNTAPIYSVNVTTGVFTPGPNLQGSGGSFDLIPGATFHNGSLYAIESSPGPGDRQLVVVDVNTGAITPIGSVHTNSAFNAIASPTRQAPLCEGVVCEGDGNECTNDACNPETGACDYPPVQDGTACTNGFCLNGVCEDPCDPNPCGSGATCRVIGVAEHVCECNTVEFSNEGGICDSINPSVCIARDYYQGLYNSVEESGYNWVAECVSPSPTLTEWAGLPCAQATDLDFGTWVSSTFLELPYCAPPQMVGVPTCMRLADGSNQEWDIRMTDWCIGGGGCFSYIRAHNVADGQACEAPLCEGVACEDDGNECTRDVCNAETGTCDYPAVQDGTACTNGFCLNGVCEDPCDPNPCGSGATCRVIGIAEHVCECDTVEFSNEGGICDVISPFVCIARDYTMGLYNSVDEPGYDRVGYCVSPSPTLTEWASLPCAQATDIDFGTWVSSTSCTPPGMVGVPACMRLTDGSNQEWDIRMTDWCVGGGGCFSYIRAHNVADGQACEAPL